jgi:hypothetical protein
LIEECWNEISSTTIQKCWNKSKILDDNQQMMLEELIKLNSNEFNSKKNEHFII